MDSAKPPLSDLYAGTLDCVHCGLCLDDCPTYRVTGRESASPRGRVFLMRGVAEGEIELDDDVARELHLCLGCRACESACPSGVRYGAMLEQARSRIADAGLRDGWGPRLERLALGRVVASPRRLGALMALAAFVQGLGLDRLLAPLLPKALARGVRMLPRIPARSLRARLPERTPAKGEQRGRVALLEGCVMPELFGAVNRDTVTVLAENGFEVIVPPAQACCGALHAHAGDMSSAIDLAERNVSAFGAIADCDYVVTNSAGCGAALRELDVWLGEDAAHGMPAVRDVCELLDAVGLRAPKGRVSARVCYDDPCHLLHGQGVSAAPRNLLRAIPGLQLVEHDDPGACCGAAGTYNLTHPEMSEAVLGSKLDALEAAGPDIVATGNPGCLLQLRAGAQDRGLHASVVHPVELLASAYRQSG